MLRGITSKSNGNFYYLNFFHFFRTKNKLGSHRAVSQNKDFSNVVMPPEDTRILEFNQFQKSDKASFIIYPVPECLIEKIDGCENNLKIYPQQK